MFDRNEAIRDIHDEVINNMSDFDRGYFRKELELLAEKHGIDLKEKPKTDKSA